MTVPPSTAIVWPVTSRLASDTSQWMVPTRSDGARLRAIACPALIVSNACSAFSAKNSRAPSVTTALLRNPCASHVFEMLW
jgi:hypothetical protein